ncbi:MAG: SurA N-terminal domain-containing protein [Pseudomonadota bacterium]
MIELLTIPFKRRRTRTLLAAPLLAGALALAASVAPAGAVSTRVVATVNDTAISGYQVSQRIKLLKILRPDLLRGSKQQQEKVALQNLIDEKLKTAEAKRLRRLLPNDRVEKIIAETPNLQNLAKRLKSQGLSARLVNTYIATRMSWNRIVSDKHPNLPPISDSQIDASMGKFQRDFQRQVSERAVSIYELLPITLPVDRQATPELTGEVARSRLIEADRIAKRFKSCGSARKAASGVFNVQIGRRLPADPSKMTAKMRQTLDRAGPGSAFVMGVAPDRSSVQIMAFCGRKRIAPDAPKITRDMVKQRLEDERFENLGKSYLRDLHKNAFIEYKDASLRK